MKRYRCAPDLRNTTNTANGIAQCIDEMFKKEHRKCVKAFFLQRYCNWTSGKALSFIGESRSQNHESFIREFWAYHQDVVFAAKVEALHSAVGNYTKTELKAAYKRNSLKTINRL